MGQKGCFTFEILNPNKIIYVLVKLNKYRLKEKKMYIDNISGGVIQLMDEK